MQNDRAWKQYSEHVRTELIPKLMDSATCLMIISGNGDDFDVKQATELGAILLLDKPLILLQAPGAKLPSRLRLAADIVLEDFDFASPEAQDQLAEVMQKLGLL